MFFFYIFLRESAIFLNVNVKVIELVRVVYSLVARALFDQSFTPISANNMPGLESTRPQTFN